MLFPWPKRMCLSLSPCGRGLKTLTCISLVGHSTPAVIGKARQRAIVFSASRERRMSASGRDTREEKRRKAIQQSFVSEKKIIWQGRGKEATGKRRTRGMNGGG